MEYPMLDSDLEALKNAPELKGRTFGVTRIQRHLGIGYSRAEKLISVALRDGILIRDSDKEWMVRLSK